MSEVSSLILERVRDVPDYPKPGIVFKDITPLLADSRALRSVVDELADAPPYEEAGAPPYEKVAGIEARGFILAAPVACRRGAGFVPIRKQGKLPWKTYEQSYALEYGEAAIEVHRDAFEPGERVLIVDDVLATGGTAAAAVELMRRAGAEVVGISVLMELSFLNGRGRLPDVPYRALVVV